MFLIENAYVVIWEWRHSLSCFSDRGILRNGSGLHGYSAHVARCFSSRGRYWLSMAIDSPAATGLFVASWLSIYCFALLLWFYFAWRAAFALFLWFCVLFWLGFGSMLRFWIFFCNEMFLISFIQQTGPTLPVNCITNPRRMSWHAIWFDVFVGLCVVLLFNAWYMV